MGTSLLSGKVTDDGKDSLEQTRPSLTRIIVSINTHTKCQLALGHVLTALQIAYARDTIVNALSGVVLTSVQEKDTQSDSTTSVDGIPLSSLTPDDGIIDPTVQAKSVVSQLEEFTQFLTAEDARVMVDLLKLAVSGRVGEKGKETLSAILTALGEASPEVSIIVHSCSTSLSIHSSLVIETYELSYSGFMVLS